MKIVALIWISFCTLSVAHGETLNYQDYLSLNFIDDIETVASHHEYSLLRDSTHSWTHNRFEFRFRPSVEIVVPLLAKLKIRPSFEMIFTKE